MIIADENIEQHWIDLLRSAGFDVFSIRETLPSISDKEIVGIVKERQGILLTEDKDFGEMIFAHGVQGLSVVFLRYNQPQYNQIEHAVLSTMISYHDRSGHFSIIISPSTIRIRNI